MKALGDRSRAPKSVDCRTTHEVERLICTEKPIGMPKLWCNSLLPPSAAVAMVEPW